MYIHLFGMTGGMPFSARIREIAHSFFLFDIHRDHRLVSFLKRKHFAIDLFKLSIPVWMLASFLTLPVTLQAVAILFQQSGYGPFSNWMPLVPQFFG